MTHSSPPLLSAHEISGVYFPKRKDPVQAVYPTSLTILEGETLGLVGESGCGKSTLGNLLTFLHPLHSGSLQYHSKEGTIDLSHLRGRQERSLRKEIQIIFQNPFASLNPQKTIGWLLEEPLLIHKIGANRAERTKLIEEMLQDVGLSSYYKDRYPHELSGGQRQRVAIAVALMVKPRFVVCDEAVSALDVSIQAQILNLFRSLQKKYKLTYLFISHNLNVVAYMADRIGVMYCGELVEVQTTQNLMEHPLHPYTKALFSASVGFDSPLQEKSLIAGDIPLQPTSLGCAFAPRCPNCTQQCTREKPKMRITPQGGTIACHKESIE